MTPRIRNIVYVHLFENISNTFEWHESRCQSGTFLSFQTNHNLNCAFISYSPQKLSDLIANSIKSIVLLGKWQQKRLSQSSRSGNLLNRGHCENLVPMQNSPNMITSLINDFYTVNHKRCRFQ